MTLKEFAALVRDMRRAQRRYFALRTQGELALAKELEAKVDAAYLRILETPAPTLFDAQEETP